ncbi:MAG: TonB-dependent receptor plug domain-containing protein [Reichenbachiella sp.]
MKFSTKINRIAMLFFVALSQSTWAQDAGEDILELSLEDLMNIEITSVSKKAERLQDVASSIYVLTADDIMKSGATTIHEALRTVPGYWGVQDEYSSVQSSVRFSRADNTFQGTVLYLLDGTPIQDQMTSTFLFKNFDIPLEEIERIEVIRGSGGTIYGANSATGVVNIFTKNPEDYKGFTAIAEGATPGYFAASLHAGGAISEKFAISGYAKARQFSGWESLAGKDEDGNEVHAQSRFTEDYEKSTMWSMGLKMNFNLSEKTKISLRTHYNTLSKIDYSNYFTGDNFDLFTQTIISDELVLNDTRSSRFTSNLRLDQTFNENHSLFFRISTNQENDFSKLGGGYNISNHFYDFEVQDNISLGSFNDLSIGANYRLVNFDVHDINYTGAINYIDPQASENLKGAFVQDKIKLMDGKLNFTLGIKAENYSLVNDDFYFSPMAKISFIPSETMTIWGGFTQSYTTPGFNNTNIDLTLFETPSAAAWTQAATAGVYGGAYELAYQGAIDAGQSETDAAAFAQVTANNYIASPEGQAVIATTADGLMTSNPSVAVKNGSNTVPTRFQTFEVGFRTKLGGQFSFETNFFYSNITDGIGVSADSGVLPNEESPTRPGEFATYYQYGNYLKGNTLGTETMIRYQPIAGLSFELAHSWLKSTWEYQENSDFDISVLDDVDQTPETPKVPEQIFKFRANYDVTETINVNLSLIYATEFSTQAEYRFDQERYENVAIGEPSTTIAANDSRTIVNLRIEKTFLDNQLAVYAFGNDIFNDGMIAATDNVYNVTLSQIGAMYGAGIQYRLK